MDVLLIGTGSAEGMPNPYCGCATCEDFRAHQQIRTPTAVLVDDRLLLDCGAQAPLMAERAGHSIRNIQAVLITHAHTDHLDPSFLLYRHWVDSSPLTVVGPAPVIAQCKLWQDERETQAKFIEVKAGQIIELVGYRITVLAANHQAFGAGVLYLIEDQNKRIFYATDTGLLPAQSLELLKGSALDLILLEETFGERTDLTGEHLNFATFAQTLAVLREVGAVTNSTKVVAVHLSHHNPPLAELTERLSAQGVEVHPDGTLLAI